MKTHFKCLILVESFANVLGEPSKGAVWKVETFRILHRNARITSKQQKGETVEIFLSFLPTHGKQPRSGFASVSYFPCTLAIVTF